MRRLCVVAGLILAASTASIIAQPKPGEPPRPVHPRVDLAFGYEVQPEWPSERPKLPWGAMAGAAVDRDGAIWTLNRGDEPVQAFSPEGKLLRTWPKGDIQRGHQLRIDRNGFVWVPDLDLHVIRKFDKTGKLLLTVGTPGKAGATETNYFLPCDIAVAANGDLFIADGYGNNRVVHTDATGKFIKSWGKMGTADGEFSLPHSIVVDSKGLLYVADRNNNRVQVFDPSGKHVRSWTGHMVPWTIYINDRDELYIIGSSPMRWRKEDALLGIPPKDQIVMHVTRDFRVLHWWSFPFQPEKGKEQPGDLNWVHALAVDAQGNLFLGDVMGNRIQKFVAKAATK